MAVLIAAAAAVLPDRTLAGRRGAPPRPHDPPAGQHTSRAGRAIHPPVTE
jgi:hypothetical protein